MGIANTGIKVVLAAAAGLGFWGACKGDQKAGTASGGVALDDDSTARNRRLAAAGQASGSLTQLVFGANKLETESAVYELDPSRMPGVNIQQLVAELIDNERIAGRFLKLVPMPSQSCKAGAVAEYGRKSFEELGIQAEIDDYPAQVAQKVAKNPDAKGDFYCNNGETAPTYGNVIAFLPATNPTLTTWNLNVHLDTLQTKFDPPTREGDVVTPVAGSPLGADDKLGLAIVLEVARALKALEAKGVQHGEVRFVGLADEEDTGGGAQLIRAEALKGRISVTVDGTDPNQIGKSAPTIYRGHVTIRTETSHPFAVDLQRTVSACAVGAKFMTEAGFETDAHPTGRPSVLLHSFFQSCGIDEGAKTAFGVPMATPKNNTITPYYTMTWQLRSAESPEGAAQMVTDLQAKLNEVCERAAKDRTPVVCEMTGTDKPKLVGYETPPDFPGIRLLTGAFETLGGPKPEVTARQFGGFNGNVFWDRFGMYTLLTGTGASNYEHTNRETGNIAEAGRVARGVLTAMLDSYRYRRVEAGKAMTYPDFEPTHPPK